MGFNDGRSYYVYLLLKYLKRNGHEVFLGSNNKDAEERIEGSGAEFIYFEGMSDKMRMMGVKSVLTDFVRQNGVDVIHSHHRYYELLANSVKKETGVKTVFTALSFVDRRYYVEYRSDRLIAVSEPVKEMMISKFGIVADKISIIPNFTDSEELVINSGRNEPGNKFIKLIKEKKENGFKILLSVGRYHKDKDHFTLLKAISPPELSKTFTVIIGSGDLEKEYIKLIKDYKLNAVLVPAQKDLTPFYLIADICILCSERDPLPGFLLQSGLFRKPFIGSDTPGIKELIVNNVNGLIFRMGNFSELKDKINMLTDSSELADALSQKLHEKIMKDFTEQTIIPQIEKIYYSFKKKNQKLLNG